jgi:DeoR/GlpR family transcriptional regulator of sugar metabolism
VTGHHRARLDAIMNALAATSFGARIEELVPTLGRRADRIRRDLNRLEHDHLVASDIVIHRAGGTSVTWRLRWDEWEKRNV